MAKYASREEMFDDYLTTNRTTWDKWIMSLTIPASRINQVLYHISFKDDLQGDWKPLTKQKLPQDKQEEIWYEPLPDRVSTAPSLEQCFLGIFNNIYDLLKGMSKKHPTITFHVYRAIPKSNCRVLTPEVMHREWLLYDAHVTNEYALIGDVEMVYDRTIIIENTADLGEPTKRYTRPFNNEMYDMYMCGIPFNVVETRYPQKENFVNALNFTGSPDLILARISQEAGLNPLAALNESLVNKFSLLMTEFNALRLTLQANISVSHVNGVKPSKLKSITDSNNYMQLMNYAVGVPDGFKGPLLPYMALINEALGKYLDIRNHVLKPAITEMSVLLANPDRLSSATTSTVINISVDEKARKAFESRVGDYYSTKNQNDQLAFSRLFSSNSEFLDAGRMSEMLNDNLQKAEKVLKGVIVDINTLTDLCERLAIRITQDKQVYGINNRMANDIAQAVSLVANEVSFFTSLMVMGEQAVGVLENLVKKM